MGIRNERYRKKINLVAYPRSGMHFIRGTLENYGIRIYWGHDKFTNFKLPNVCYIHRNPVNVMYSWQAVNHQIGRKSKKFREAYILKKAKQLKVHRDYYFENAGCIINLDEITKDKSLWKPVIEFFQKEYDDAKLDLALAQNTKEKIIEKFTGHYGDDRPYKWVNLNMMTDEYEENRKLFHEMFSEKIESIVLGDK